MKTNRHIVASIFLILFSFIQFADLHSVSHDDTNDVDCELCEFITANSDITITPAAVSEIPEPVSFAIINCPSYNTSPKLIGSFYLNKLHNKAPPIV